MAMATHGTRATFRSVSVRQPVRTTLQKASYTRWQMMPAPAWCADNKERLEQLPKEFEAMTVDIFKDPSVSTPDDDQAAYVPHEREMVRRNVLVAYGHVFLACALCACRDFCPSCRRIPIPTTAAALLPSSRLLLVLIGNGCNQ
eukprot:TRINITY_DN44878_c0_g1_i4.p1 TRINITY_DN44878_c0_g1~~TRINITY_DN44878_c0_g1_i4.p1  ORF type:complete len:168 (-),score=12.25 TRINITY_DN44878_c0_g1_i4:19-450(-)